VERSLKGDIVPPYTLYPVSHPSIRSSAEAVYQKRGSFAACVNTRHTHTEIVARGCREIGTQKESRCIQELCVCSYLSCSFSPCRCKRHHSSARSANITIHRCNMTQEKKRNALVSTLFLYKKRRGLLFSQSYTTGPNKYFSRGTVMGEKNEVAKINENLDRKKRNEKRQTKRK
jgi:hypothetical protein